MNVKNGNFLLTPELIKSIDATTDMRAAVKQKREETDKLETDLIEKTKSSITHYEEVLKSGKLSDYEKKGIQEKIVELKKLLNDVNKKRGKEK